MIATAFAVGDLIGRLGDDRNDPAPALRLEMQYALQYRHDQRRGKVTPTIVGRW